jgi:glycosyltransferase involved in cell wall biosynthesis
MVLSPSDARMLSAHRVPGVVHVPNGVWLHDSSEPGRTQPLENGAVADADTRERPLTVIAVGRLERQKAFDRLIRVAGLLAGTHPGRFRYRIVGDGSERNALQQLAIRTGVEDIVEFAGGQQPQIVRDLYRQADIFALPSVWEGFPLTLVEAWSAALPAVVARVGAIPHLVHDEVDGLLVDATNDEEISSVLARLANDPSLRHALAAAGRKRVVNEFDWRRISGRVECVYMAALGR